MGESQFFHGAQPWGWHTHDNDGWTASRYLIHELKPGEDICFRCPLYLADGSDCDQTDDRCPFNENRSKAKRDRMRRARQKRIKRLERSWMDEVDAACRAVMAAKEARE